MTGLEPYSPEYGRTRAIGKRDGGVQMVEPESPGGAVREDENGRPYVVYRIVLAKEVIPDSLPAVIEKGGEVEIKVGVVVAHGADEAIEYVARRDEMATGTRLRAIAERNHGPVRTWVEQTKFGLE